MQFRPSLKQFDFINFFWITKWFYYAQKASSHKLNKNAQNKLDDNYNFPRERPALIGHECLEPTRHGYTMRVKHCYYGTINSLIMDQVDVKF